MAEKLSERIRSEIGCWPSTSSLAAVLRECEELARRVEGAPVADLSECCGHVTVGETWGDDYEAVFAPIMGQRVRLVPDAGKGGG